MQWRSIAIFGGCLLTATAWGQQSAKERERYFDLESHRIQRISSPQRDHLRARLLTASCAACHGTHGESAGITPSLAGMERSYFVRQMRDFALGVRPGTVMNTHAAGYTAEEITIMAELFASATPCNCHKPTPSSDLSGGVGEERSP